MYYHLSMVRVSNWATILLVVQRQREENCGGGGGWVRGLLERQQQPGRVRAILMDRRERDRGVVAVVYAYAREECEKSPT